MAASHFNFTERELDRWVSRTLKDWQAHAGNIPIKTGEAWARDRGGPASIPGLRLRLRLRREGGSWTTRAPVVGFYLYKKINGRLVNRFLGDRNTTSVFQARAAAAELTKQLGAGKDPNVEQRKAAEVKTLQALTYQQALEQFLADSPALTEGTRKKYRLSLSTTFKTVADKPLAYLTPRRVRAIHEKRSQESQSRADQDMRVLRLLWNWVQDKHQTEAGEAVLGDNPVATALNKKRAGQTGWNRVPRKESIIPRAKLPEWFQALHGQHDAVAVTRARRTSALLLEALVLTGLRFNELAQLTWADVDQARGVLTVADRTSKNRRALVRPLTRRVKEILQQTGTTEGHVFPGRHKDKPLNDTRPLQVELQASTGLWITPHDLRRVYTSAASRAGLPAVVIKRLLNHISTTEEVTEGYIRLGLDELLDYSQTVENTILGDAGLLASNNLDNRLQDLLAGLDESEKRRLLFELAQRQQGIG